MTHIAFFGHNANDAAVRRRAVSFLKAGFDLTGFMPHRGERKPVEWTNVDLGESRDFDYSARVRSIFTGGRQAAGERAFATADLIYARNLDMLATAHRARARAGLQTPVVYECLDVHKRLTGPGPDAVLLRALERWLLKRSTLITVSSPAFEREYFAKRHAEHYRCFLIENRLVEGDDFPPRPGGLASVDPAAPLRLGWFGNLRCHRSFEALKQIAARFGDRLNITFRGYTTPGVFADFEGDVAKHPNMQFHGRFQAPQDLAQIYREVDLVWAGDYYEKGANSLWLLPNRIYEGGYFATPAIAPKGTETGRWIEDRGAGFTVAEPIEHSLSSLLGQLIEDRGAIAESRAKLLTLPRETFVEPAGFIRRLVDAALRQPAESLPAGTVVSGG
ncbi:MAG: glycosyl transferase [Pseudomonadota bacterium]